jgi:uncharacterized protein YciI
MSADEPAQPKPEQDDPMQMRRLTLVFMVKGPNWTAGPSRENQRNQAEHLDLLKRLHRSGELLLSGPIPDGHPERGVLVFDLSSQDEVRALLADDVFITSGHLALEMYPWLVPAEYLERPFRSADRDG